MDPLIFVALMLFVAMVALWIVLPGRVAVEEESAVELMPPLVGHQQA